MNQSSLRFALCTGLALAMLAGCGDDSPHGGGGGYSNGVAGTIGGKTFDVQSVISGVYVSNGKPAADVVMMANEPDLCAKISAGGLQNPPSFQMLFFSLSDVDFATGQTSLPAGAGTFEVLSAQSPSTPKTNHVASVFYMESDAMGMDVYPDLVVGTTGTITLDAVGAQNAFSGKGDFALSTGDALKIEYDATPCAALANFDPSNTPNAPPAQGAWNFAFVDSGISCPIVSHQTAVGQVDAASASSRVVDGDNGASVSCSVSGPNGGPFVVTGTTTDSMGSSLSINIPAITVAATKAVPAAGTVSYASLQTGGNSFTGACNFYFVPGTPQGVNAGKIWVAFTCPGLESQMDMCMAAESYALFENCAEN